MRKFFMCLFLGILTLDSQSETIIDSINKLVLNLMVRDRIFKLLDIFNLRFDWSWEEFRDEDNLFSETRIRFKDMGKYFLS